MIQDWRRKAVMQELLRVNREFMQAPANDVANLGDDVVDGFTGSTGYSDWSVAVSLMAT
jgi:hypothetical protein